MICFVVAVLVLAGDAGGGDIGGGDVGGGDVGGGDVGGGDVDGGDVDDMSCFRNSAAPSLNAWLVFSIAFLSPTSDHSPVSISFSKKRPGVPAIARTCATIDREIVIFCRLVLATYVAYIFVSSREGKSRIEEAHVPSQQRENVRKNVSSKTLCMKKKGKTSQMTLLKREKLAQHHKH